MKVTRKVIEARWGVLFWKLVADFADQGLSRSDTARAMGYKIDSFYKLLARNQQHDPFDTSVIPLAYLNDTGESMRRALERMAAEGRSWGYAARIIGYADGARLKRAALTRGINVEMNSKHTGRPRLHPVAKKRDNLTTNWPTWEKVYAMTGGAVPEQRRKKKANGPI